MLWNKKRRRAVQRDDVTATLKKGDDLPMESVTADWRDQLENWLKNEVGPAAVETDRTGAFPAAAIDAFLATSLPGLMTAESHGGVGGGVREASEVIRRTAQVCGSTVMIVTMHYSGVAVLEACGSDDVRRDVAAGRHLSTLAFSESGSRSQFWAPISTASNKGKEYVLDASKSWVTSARYATAYVWSSRGSNGDGVTLWLTPSDADGLEVIGNFDGLGLRGNDSVPVRATSVHLPASAMLGEDGKGLDLMLGVVLPVFSILNSSASIGMMEAAVERTIEHASGVHFQHTSEALRDLSTMRAYLARIRIKTDMVRTLLNDTIDAIETSRPDANLRVLQIKAAAGETATEVLDTAMRVCGGAAFRKEVGVERIFRDARASTVMAPTADQLYDFIGRAISGLDLF